MSTPGVSIYQYPRGFKELTEALLSVNPVKAAEAVRDGTITLDEAAGCFDHNANGLTRDDFLTGQAMRQPKLFNRVDQIMSPRGMDLSTAVHDWSESVNYFAQTGEAPPAYLYSKRFLSDAIATAPHALGYVHLSKISFEDFDELARQAVKKNPHAIGHTYDGYQLSHPDLVQELLLKDPLVFLSLTGAFHVLYPEITWRVVKKFPPLLEYTSSTFQMMHPQELQELVAQSGHNLRFVSPVAQVAHEEVVLTALRRNEEAYDFISLALRVSLDFLADAVMANFNVWEYVRNDMVARPFKDMIWHVVKSRVGKQGIRFPSGMMDSYDDFVRGLSEHGVTDYPRRIRSFKTAHRLFADRIEKPDDTRPVALLLFNRNDDEAPNAGAFDAYPLIDDFVESGFRVVYREIESSAEFFNALKEETDSGAKPVYTLVVAGHGTELSLQLGKDKVPGALDPKLQTKDFYECFSESPVQSGGQVFIYACNNGRGKHTSKNLANSLASIFPDDITLYSQPVSGNIRSLRIKDDHSLDIDFWVGPDDPINKTHNPFMTVGPYVIRSGQKRMDFVEG